MAAIDDILAFEWPQDCNQQSGAMTLFLSYLSALYDEWQQLVSETLQLNQSTPPTEGEWQSAWLESGFDLPIPDHTQLLWFSTADGVFGGEYTVVDGFIVRVENRFYRGRSDFVAFPTGDITLKASAAMLIDFPFTTFMDGIAVATFGYTRETIEYTLNGSGPYVGVVFCDGFEHPVISVYDSRTTRFTFLHPTLLTPGNYLFVLTVTSTPAHPVTGVFSSFTDIVVPASVVAAGLWTIPPVHAFLEFIYEMTP